jgi:hypothetical protein
MFGSIAHTQRVWGIWDIGGEQYKYEYDDAIFEHLFGPRLIAKTVPFGEETNEESGGYKQLGSVQE